MNKCPQCGYVEVPEPNKAHTIMNHYFTEDGKKNGFMNRTEEKFEVTVGEGKDAVVIKWVRKDVYDKQLEAAAKAKAPEAPKK